MLRFVDKLILCIENRNYFLKHFPTVGDEYIYIGSLMTYQQGNIQHGQKIIITYAYHFLNKFEFNLSDSPLSSIEALLYLPTLTIEDINEKFIRIKSMTDKDLFIYEISGKVIVRSKKYRVIYYTRKQAKKLVSILRTKLL